MIGLFFPLAFFLIIIVLVVVNLAYFVLPDAGRLVTITQQVLAAWFAVFSIAILGLLIFTLALLATGRVSVPVDTVKSSDQVVDLALLSFWLAAFLLLNIVAAYLLLILRAVSVRGSASGEELVCEFPFREERVNGQSVDRIVEVVYSYAFFRLDGTFKTRSFFLLARKNRCAPFRYTLFCPPSSQVEDSFRQRSSAIVPLTTVDLLARMGLPGKGGANR